MAAPHITAMSEVEFDSVSHRVENLNIDPVKSDVHETTGQIPISKRDTPVTGAQWTEPSFDYWLAGSGTAGTPPAFDAALLSCGLNYANDPGTSDTYLVTGDLVTDTTPVDITQSLGDAVSIACKGCVGNMSIALRPGEPAKASFTFAGKYTEPTEAALSASIATSAHPPACKGMVITVGTKTLKLKEVNINLNNENNSPNYSIYDTTGIEAPDLVNQMPEWDVLAVLPDFSTANYWADLTAETETAFSAVLGATAGNILTITGDGYLRAAPEITDVGGVVCVRLRYRMGWGADNTKLTSEFT